MNVLLLCVVVAACGTSSKQPTEGSGATPSGSAVTPPPPADAPPTVAVDAAAATAPSGPAPDPTAKAKELLDAQVAALGTCGESAALIATFSPDAVVFTPPGWRAVKDPNAGICEAIAITAPGQTVKSIKPGKLVAGGNASAVWLNTTLEITATGAKPRTIRVTEVMAAPGWKVAAAAFTDADRQLGTVRPTQPPVPGASTAGPLAALLAVPTELDAALASDPAVAVFGTDAHEVAFRAEAAHKLLAGWSLRKLSVKSAREVREAQWGYVQATVAWDKGGEDGTLAMCATVIAVPGAGGTWSVVAANFGAE